MLALAWPAPGVKAADAPVARMPMKHRALFERYCFDCHDAETEKGNVNLEALSWEISADNATADRWKHILNTINSGEMPPPKKKQIPPGEKAAFLKDLSEQMVVARKVLSDDGGYIALRRLNRREYANSVETLLGVRPEVSGLPDDQATAGFDTQGASLFMSANQLENYLAAAKDALKLALYPAPQPASRIVRVEPEQTYTPLYANAADGIRDRTKRARAFLAQDTRPASDFGFLDAYAAKRSSGVGWLPLFENYLARPETKTGATLIMTIKQGGYTRIKLPPLGGVQAGRYTLRLRAAAYPGAEERLHYLEFTAVDGGTIHRLGWRKVTGTLAKPQVIEFAIEHPVGKKIQYVVHQRSHQDRGDKNLTTLHQRKNGVGQPPGLWVDWAEMEGPLPDNRPATGSQVLFPRPEGLDDLEYGREILRRFAVTAFRGTTPSVEYLERLNARFAANLKKGLALKAALIEPLAIVLSSPGFLYMVESGAAADSKALAGHELAVRLAYFLWSEPPDAELLRLAKAGKLSDPAVLRAQTDRMLNDPRRDRFLRGFVHQWLEMERLDMFQYNALLFPQFDNAVREHAHEEIHATVRTLLEEGLPVQTLLKADFVVVNDLLAAYYGLPGVQGHNFRKVKLPPGARRGGLLGTAAIHAMGSDGIRSSPVERGSWILRHLLHSPPPPAPPNVPMLSRLDGTPRSNRERQILHQEEPQCAQCHQKIDPLGYALENFDAAGRWRDKEGVFTARVTVRRHTPSDEFPIQSGGRLPNGDVIDGFHGLREYVAGRGDAFARGLAEALITYGLGRPYGFSDDPLVDSILSQARRGNHNLRQYIHALVQSKAFLTR